MQGDKLIIHEGHIRAGQQIVDIILPDIKKSNGVYVITIAGESGSGKSETAECVARALSKNNITSFIFQQDDYFVYPPKTNASMRTKNINQVGMSEVKLDLIDQQLNDLLKDQTKITKPLVIFDDDTITQETVDLKDIKVIIVEGTYTTSLKNVHSRVFIDRNRIDTLESRKKRAREDQDEFLEKILLIEHNIIKEHKALASIIVSKDYHASRA